MLNIVYLQLTVVTFEKLTTDLDLFVPVLSSVFCS